MFPMRIVLCPIDFSDCSRPVFRLACLMAREQGARLVVLHVHQPLGPTAGNGESLAGLEPAACREKLLEALRHFQVPDLEIQVEHDVAEGDPALEILRVAEERNCDSIVMGWHGRTGLERLLLGGVAQQVLRKARCPVVTVKLPPVPVSPECLRAARSIRHAETSAEFAFRRPFAQEAPKQ